MLNKKLKQKISEKLYNARKIKSINQTQASVLVDIDPSHYRHIENGDNLPSIPVLFNLAEKLDFTLDDIINENSDNERLNIISNMINKLNDRDFRLIVFIISNMIKTKTAKDQEKIL